MWSLPFPSLLSDVKFAREGRERRGWGARTENNNCNYTIKIKSLGTSLSLHDSICICISVRCFIQGSCLCCIRDQYSTLHYTTYYAVSICVVRGQWSTLHPTPLQCTTDYTSPHPVSDLRVLREEKTLLISWRSCCFQPVQQSNQSQTKLGTWRRGVVRSNRTEPACHPSQSLSK